MQVDKEPLGYHYPSGNGSPECSCLRRSLIVEQNSVRSVAVAVLLLCCLLPLGAIAAGAADDRLLLPQGEVHLDPVARDGKCLAADLLEDEGALPAMTADDLAPGHYLASFSLRVSHTVDRHVARMRFTLAAERGDTVLAEREFSLLAFETPNRYQGFAMPFTVKRRGTVSFGTRFTWDGIRGERRPYPKTELPTGPGDGGDGDSDFELEHHLKDLGWHLALDRITLSPPHEVVVEDLAVGKIRYRPGEEATVTGSIMNYSGRERTVAAIVELVRDMDTVREVGRVELVLPARGRESLDVTAKLANTPWGREARVRIVEDGRELHRTAAYFTVHDNPWAVAIGAYGLQLAWYRAGGDSFKNCRPLAQGTKRHYGNMVEFVFWAEDDFGDLTPTDDRYWCGQLRHPGGAEATRQLIKAFHDVGVACSFYALYTAADGKAGYELYRKHPDWFRPGFYDVSHLDRWDRSQDLISWPRLGVRADTPEPYRHHAQEIIRSARDFGWDAIRYDTDMSVREMDGAQPHVATYFPETKKIVNKALPKFQWGYNDGLHRRDLGKEPELKKLFATLCEGGGMIMDEYNNHAFQDRWTYERYAARHRSIRKMVHDNGGHFTLCPFDLDWVSDQVYQGILPLVARGHHAWDPHKGQVPYANYHQFSTRYAGAIWDPAAVVLAGAAERVDWGEATNKLFHPHDYVYLRPRGEGRTDLVLHLVNPPPERACSYDDNRVNPPMADIPGMIALPDGLTARAVYAASAEPALHQQTLEFAQRDGKLAFTVPKVRFWNMVVAELEGKGVW